ncbi:hypothetical protein D3C74_135950 [compost metagenome]
MLTPDIALLLLYCKALTFVTARCSPVTTSTHPVSYLVLVTHGLFMYHAITLILRPDVHNLLARFTRKLSALLCIRVRDKAELPIKYRRYTLLVLIGWPLKYRRGGIACPGKGRPS